MCRYIFHILSAQFFKVEFSMFYRSEKEANRTCFLNFMPFLWGRSAASHYSVRTDISTALWRQPRTGDVLNILQQNFVYNTIKHYPLHLSLNSSELHLKCATKQLKHVYDLSFLLPLFAQLLAPENAVQTYRFTKSGALALTIAALGSEDEIVRKACCHVLARFYHHQEARQTGKDNLLWLRFVEAVCKGTAVLDDFKLNSFAAIFLARMSMVLTQPAHVMYVPLSQYLGAKSAPDFSSVPELYTLLHSSDINYKEHRTFSLEVLRDGMRTKKDFDVALRSMSFKLIMELFDSTLSDTDTKVLILDVFKSACKIEIAVKLLCSSYGMLSWLFGVIRNVNSENVNSLLPPVIDIILNILKTKLGNSFVDVMFVSLIIGYLVDNFLSLLKNRISILETIHIICESNELFLNETRLRSIINCTGNRRCEYMLDYGCKFVDKIDSSHEKDENFYVCKITQMWGERL